MRSGIHLLSIMLSILFLFLSCSEKKEAGFVEHEPVYQPGTPEFIHVYNAYNSRNAGKLTKTQIKDYRENVKSGIIESLEDKSVRSFFEWLISERHWHRIIFRVALCSVEDDLAIRARFDDDLKAELIGLVNTYAGEPGKEVNWITAYNEITSPRVWQNTNCSPSKFMSGEVSICNKHIEDQMRKYININLIPYYTKNVVSPYMVEVLQSFMTDSISTVEFLLDIDHNKLKSQAGKDKIIDALATLAESMQEFENLFESPQKTGDISDQLSDIAAKLKNMGIKNLPWIDILSKDNNLKRTMRSSDLAGAIAYAAQKLLSTGATPSASGK